MKRALWRFVASTLAVTAYLLGVPVHSQQVTNSASTPLSPTQFVELPRVSDVSVSDDGAFIGYAHASVDWDENERVERLKILACENRVCNETDILSLPDELQTGAIWRPGSHEFIVVAEMEGNDNEQAYLVDPVRDQRTTLTNHSEDVTDVQWLPDGSAFLFKSDLPLSDKPFGDEAIDGFSAQDSEALYIYDFSSGTTRVVFESLGIIEGYSVARSGDQLIARQRFDPEMEDRNSAELWLIDITTGATTQLTRNRYRENSARLSPDGRSFAFVATVNEDGDPYFEDNLFVQAVSEDRPTLLMSDQALEVLDFEWDPNGEVIWFTGNSGLRTQLYKLTLAGGEVEQITSGDHSLASWLFVPDSGKHFGRLRSASNPGEISEISAANGMIIDRTDIFGDALKGIALPKQKPFNWRASDGQSLDGLVVYPIGYSANQTYPLVTITHGGPRSSSQFGSWNTSRYVSVLSGQGYAVFLPNHRGGTGYGDDFMRDMVGDYFRNAHTDVLSGIDALIEEGIADPERLIKMGWSAGGHMTNKLITATDRFRAASSGAGVADWVSLYGESDRRAGRTPWFGGTPWQDGAPLNSFRRQSPIFDVWKVETPTLFWTGGNDERVPPTQAILMYRGVRDTGTPTDLYVGKGEPHNFRKPHNILFKINRELSWFAEHLGRAPYNPDLPTGQSEPEYIDQDAAPVSSP